MRLAISYSFVSLAMLLTCCIVESWEDECLALGLDQLLLPAERNGEDFWFCVLVVHLWALDAAQSHRCPT
jgi:hypothetical protein